MRREIRALPRDSRQFARVLLKDWPIDKDALLGFLNGTPPTATQLRAWRVGSRGSLIPIQPYDD